MRATCVPSQYHLAQPGQWWRKAAERSTRAGTSPRASNACRCSSAVPHSLQRLKGGPAGSNVAASRRSAAATSPRPTVIAGTSAQRRGRRTLRVRTVRPSRRAAARSSSSRAPASVTTS